MPYGTVGIGVGGGGADVGLMAPQHYIGQHYHQPHHHQHQHHHHSHLQHTWYEPQQPQHQTHTSWYAGVGGAMGPGQSGNETLANNYYSY